MQARTASILSVSAILIGAITIGLYAQNKCSQQPPQPQPPPPPPQQPQPPPTPRESRRTMEKPEGPPQPTRIQIDLFGLTCATDQLVKLDIDQIGADRASSAQVLERLAKFGDAKHLIRVDNVVNLAEESNITQGVRKPVVKDVTISKAGTTTPSVDYEEVGFIAEFKGQWRDGGPDSRSDIVCTIEMSGVNESGIQVASGVNLPTFNNMKIEQKMSLTGGVPVLILSNDLPISKDDKLVTHVTLVRLLLTRLPD